LSPVATGKAKRWAPEAKDVGRPPGSKPEQCHEWVYYKKKAEQAHTVHETHVKDLWQQHQGAGKSADSFVRPAFDLLGFWKELNDGEKVAGGARKCFCPHLCAIARRYLAAPSGGAMSESTFSSLGFIIRDERTSLKPANANILLTGQHFLRRALATLPGVTVDTPQGTMRYPSPNWIGALQQKLGLTTDQLLQIVADEE